MCLEGASETKAKGEWTNIVLLLVCQQVSEFFLKRHGHKQGVHCLFSFVMENSCLRQLEFLAGSNILDSLGW